MISASLLTIFAIEHVSSLYLEPQQAANLVIEQFVYSYKAYQQYAWGCDELYPMNKSCRNYHQYSLLWTPIAAIDTLYLMNLTDLLDDTIHLICNSNFTFNHDQYTSTFDLYIRTLGGLLSGYYFTQEPCLKELAIDVGNRIYNVFNTETPSGLPYKMVNMATGDVDTSSAETDVASIATTIIEYGALSYIANDMKYYNSAKKIMSTVQSHRSEKYGLVGNCININASSDEQFWCGSESYIDAGIDSYYEYQIKCWRLFGDEECLEMWRDSKESIMNYLSYFIEEEELLWFKRVNKDNASMLYLDSTEYDLFAAFFAGALVLSGDLNFAKMSQESNWYMWNQTGLEPSSFDFENNTAVDTDYDLNPENFESNYYLYMVTNDTVYYDRAVQYLNDLITYCKCNEEKDECVGYSSVNREGDTFVHTYDSPSFLYSETWKYLYLTFLKNEENNPLKFHDFIYTTSAHPIPLKWGQLFD